MRRQLALVLIISVFFALNCGEGMIEETEYLEGDIHSQSNPVIQKTLKAIDLGIADGDNLMTVRINAVLQTYGVKYFYNGMSTLADYSKMNNPDVGGGASCPYVGPKASAGSDTGPTSCNYLAMEAATKAQLAMDAVNPNNKIDENFSNGDGKLTLYRTWFANGLNSAMDTTTVLLAGTLRKNGVCDNNPTPKTSAYNKGVALGRKLYKKAMNERLKLVGIDFNYPGGKNPSKSIRYCKANLRDPVIQDSNANVASTMNQTPLCGDIGGDPIEQSAYLTQYKQVEKQYQAGIFAGVMKEDSLAQGVLKGGGVCIASPLVLDLAGDGINLGGSARFDLLSNGSKVESSWVQGDDALLVRDVNGNGKIDDATELFGNDATHDNGFVNLAALDSNRDGRIDSQDPIYSTLRLWQDADGDGVSTDDELSKLQTLGVKAIELSYTEGARVDRHGNQFRQSARFVRTAAFARALGATGTVVDVWFSYR